MYQTAQHATVLESYADLARYNLMQPHRVDLAGAAARKRQWERISGRSQGAATVWVLLGAGVGFAIGSLFGIDVVPTVLANAGFSAECIAGTVPNPICSTIGGGNLIALSGLALAPVMAAVAYGVARTQDYAAGMILTIVNERESPIIPEKVTGEAEIWVPKALVAWRIKDWRRDRDGNPFLLLMLPHGQKITETLFYTDDYLFLENDHYVANDAAVYDQRNYNRMISKSAEKMAQVEARKPDNPGKEFLPWIGAAVFLILGVVLVVLSAGS